LLKNKNPGIFNEYLYRLGRSEGPIRGSAYLIFVAAVNVYLWYSA